MKPRFTQEPTGFRARNTKLIVQQCRKINLSIKIQAAQSHTKPIETSKLTTGHFIALPRDKIQPHPQGGTSTIKRNHKLLAYRKATPNTAI